MTRASAAGLIVTVAVAVAVAGAALAPGAARAQPAPPGGDSSDPPGQTAKLEVCADPNNLPFSNRAGEGFENRLAELWARELGRELEYTWFPHRRGFERHTLNAVDPATGERLCDVIMGVPVGYDLAMTTRPYYRSTYALVYVAGGEIDVDSGAELASLPADRRDAIRIGVFTPGPAADWLAHQGMHRQMVPYPALSGDPDSYPGLIIERDLLEGRLDAAILWGPIAGYFAARAAPREVAVVPLRSDRGVRFDYAISAGVRFGDRETRALLEDVMARTADEVDALLAEYHVPVVAASGSDETSAADAANGTSATSGAAATSESDAPSGGTAE